MQLPKWHQGDFFSAIHAFQLQYEGDQTKLPGIRGEQSVKHKDAMDAFNKYKGEALNQLIDIERKLDCIIIDYFVPTEIEHLKDDFYQNMIIEGRVEFMQKRIR
ncbi:MAG: hypothetical protein IPO70_04425 [Bacteroidetes bacterium]|nr:hypothetical protein [Bacteroidota bacterium]